MSDERKHPQKRGPCGALATVCPVGERDQLRAENALLRQAIADALTNLPPGFAPRTVLMDAVESLDRGGRP